MSQVVDFLNKAKTYYLGTVKDGEARVRPIGATVEYHNKVYFATNNQKEMYKQMINNPYIAISGMSDTQWIRITGKAVVDYREEAKVAMLEANQGLKDIYSIDDGLFEVFYIDNMEAKLYSFTNAPITLED